MLINEAGLTYWEEKELELAMRILPQLLVDTQERSANFHPVQYSLYMAENLIKAFMVKKEIPFSEYSLEEESNA